MFSRLSIIKPINKIVNNHVDVFFERSYLKLNTKSVKNN